MKIVVLDGHTLNPGDNPWTPVQSCGELTVFERTGNAETIERSRTADILLTNKVVLNQATICQLPNLKFISVLATGFNVVDVEFARQHSIPVSNVPVYSTDSVAQHVMASMLSYIHQPAAHHAAIQKGDWNRNGDFSFWLAPLTELKGQTLGIVGLGRIGRATAKLAEAFGMRVVGHSRSQSNPPEIPGFQWLGLEALFAESDFISLHCPQTPATEGLVNADLISRMKPTAVLINTARGGLIDEQELADALNQGQIAAALLDVVSAEPIRDDNPLLSARNCVLTPHLAWSPIEARRRLMQTTANNIKGFQAGRPINVVN